MTVKSLYIHIPFCRWVCHYCDFAKTANYSDTVKRAYLDWLQVELARWLEAYKPRLETVFIGGGTPSVYQSEYAALFSIMEPYLGTDAEISLEANPDDITEQSLANWARLGFNRISLGVQTFQERGLRELTRQHSSDAASTAIKRSLAVFDNVNIDLIYGWQNQTIQQWSVDLDHAVALSVPHLSLYCLTYEPRTVIGRRYHRGLVQGADDDQLWDFYDTAMTKLAAHHYEHEEVSNWSKSGFTCKHNWTYWSDQSFIGIGSGAHGYLPNAQTAIGERYSYPNKLPHTGKVAPVFEQRTEEHWLMEYIGSSLRTKNGTSLRHIESIAGLKFAPDETIKQALSNGQITLRDETIVLPPREWFRETAWAGSLLDCFQARISSPH